MTWEFLEPTHQPQFYVVSQFHLMMIFLTVLMTVDLEPELKSSLKMEHQNNKLHVSNTLLIIWK